MEVRARNNFRDLAPATFLGPLVRAVELSSDIVQERLLAI